MRTVADNLREMATEIRGWMKDLLLNHSAIYKWNKPGSGLILVGGDYAWKELKEPGRQIQAKLLEEYRRFQAILEVLLREQPQDTLKLLADTEREILRTIEQRHTWCSASQEALDKVINALDRQVGLLSRLYDPSEGEPMYVPDTNALLYNPTLEVWSFGGVPRFTLVLTPTVLSELDSLKVNHRNETVRQKAEKLIRQIKEYRRRGRLTEGITLVKGVSSILAIATEPNMEISLPWLDPENNDDRLLAALIEVMRTRSRSPVILVTRDINLQNKAEFARIPFVEPPEPT